MRRTGAVDHEIRSTRLNPHARDVDFVLSGPVGGKEQLGSIGAQERIALVAGRVEICEGIWLAERVLCALALRYVQVRGPKSRAFDVEQRGSVVGQETVYHADRRLGQFGDAQWAGERLPSPSASGEVDRVVTAFGPVG